MVRIIIKYFQLISEEFEQKISTTSHGNVHSLSVYMYEYVFRFVFHFIDRKSRRYLINNECVGTTAT